jgi:hypothetical protein
MTPLIHETLLFHALCDSDLRLLSNLKFHPGRFAVAHVYDAKHGAHIALCGPGTRYPDWMQLDVHTMLDIGDWRPGNPAFERTLALMRYEDARHAGRSERHGVQILHLGSCRSVAEKAETEIVRREEQRETWEGMAA